MDIKEYIKNINKTLNHYDKCAKNPFLDYKYAYNPFKDAISQTYVWIEKDRSSKGGCDGDVSCYNTTTGGRVDSIEFDKKHDNQR